MAEPIVPIFMIIQNAHNAAEEGKPVNTCPYPPDSAAAARWRIEYYARELQIMGELTT